MRQQITQMKSETLRDVMQGNYSRYAHNTADLERYVEPQVPQIQAKENLEPPRPVYKAYQ